MQCCDVLLAWQLLIGRIIFLLFLSLGCSRAVQWCSVRVYSQPASLLTQFGSAQRGTRSPRATSQPSLGCSFCRAAARPRALSAIPRVSNLLWVERDQNPLLPAFRLAPRIPRVQFLGGCFVCPARTGRARGRGRISRVAVVWAIPTYGWGEKPAETGQPPRATPGRCRSGGSRPGRAAPGTEAAWCHLPARGSSAGWLAGCPRLPAETGRGTRALSPAGALEALASPPSPSNFGVALFFLCRGLRKDEESSPVFLEHWHSIQEELPGNLLHAAPIALN